MFARERMIPNDFLTIPFLQILDMAKAAKFHSYTNHYVSDINLINSAKTNNMVVRVLNY